MKKFHAGILAAGLAGVMLLCGCETSKSYTFTVSTGDDIEVKLDTTNGLDLKQEDGTFAVTDKDGNYILQSAWYQAEIFDQYKEQLADAEGTENIEMTDDMIVWDFVSEGSPAEHDRICRLSDKTAVLIGSQADKDTADAAFDALTLTIE